MCKAQGEGKGKTMKGTAGTGVHINSQPTFLYFYLLLDF